jgi:MFS family permease
MECNGPLSTDPVRKLRGPAIVALIVMLVAMTAFSLFIRNSVGTLAPLLRSEIGLDARMLGLANGGFFTAFLVMQLPLGLCFDRYGVRRCVVWLTWLAALGSLAGAACVEPWSFIATRVVVGIGAAGYFMGTLVIAGNWFRGQQFVGVVSWIYALSSLGTLASTAPLSWAADTFGWRTSFIVIALVTVALGVGLSAFVRDFPPDAAAREAPQQTLAELSTGWRQVWQTPGLLAMLAMAAVAYPTISTVLGTWAAPYLADVYRLGSTTRGELLLAFAIAQVLSILAWGQIAAYGIGTTRMIINCGCAATVFLGLLAVLPDPPLWLAAALLSAVCIFSSFGSLVLMEARQLFTQEIAGRGITTVNLAQVGGSAVLPIVTGLVIGFSPAADGAGSELAYRLAFGIVALALLIGLITYGMSPRVSRALRSQAKPAPGLKTQDELSDR